MRINNGAMPLLFSYGTLQETATQLATFGRALVGRADALPRFERVPLTIDDPKFVALSGRALHTNARYTGDPGSAIPGTLLELTEAEIAKADEYERLANYTRILVPLASSRSAWVYVYEPTAPK